MLRAKNWHASKLNKAKSAKRPICGLFDLIYMSEVKVVRNLVVTMGKFDASFIAVESCTPDENQHPNRMSSGPRWSVKVHPICLVKFKNEFLSHSEMLLFAMRLSY